MKTFLLGLLLVTLAIVSVFSQPVGFSEFKSIANDLYHLADQSSKGQSQYAAQEYAAHGEQSFHDRMSAQDALQQHKNRQLNAADSRQAASVTIVHKKGLNNQRYISSENVENLAQASSHGRSSKGSYADSKGQHSTASSNFQSQNLRELLQSQYQRRIASKKPEVQWVFVPADPYQKSYIPTTHPMTAPHVPAAPTWGINCI
jgi:hypothetical protein